MLDYYYSRSLSAPCSRFVCYLAVRDNYRLTVRPL